MLPRGRGGGRGAWRGRGRSGSRGGRGLSAGSAPTAASSGGQECRFGWACTREGCWHHHPRKYAARPPALTLACRREFSYVYEACQLLLQAAASCPYSAYYALTSALARVVAGRWKRDRRRSSPNRFNGTRMRLPTRVSCHVSCHVAVLCQRCPASQEASVCLRWTHTRLLFFRAAPVGRRQRCAGATTHSPRAPQGSKAQCRLQKMQPLRLPPRLPRDLSRLSQVLGARNWSP